MKLKNKIKSLFNSQTAKYILHSDLQRFISENKETIPKYHDYFWNNYYKLLQYMHDDFNITKLYDKTDIVEEIAVVHDYLQGINKKHRINFVAKHNASIMKLNGLQKCLQEYSKVLDYFKDKTKMSEWKEINIKVEKEKLKEASFLEYDTSPYIKQAQGGSFGF